MYISINATNICLSIYIYIPICIYLQICIYLVASHVTCVYMVMGWLRLVGSLKLQFSFAKEPHKTDDILIYIYLIASHETYVYMATFFVGKNKYNN